MVGLFKRLKNKEYKSKNMDYLKLFEGHSDYSSYIADNGITRPSIGFCLDENEVHFNEFDGSEQYLTFVAEEPGTFTLTIGSAVTTGDVTSVSYSLDDGETWTTVNNTASTQVTITTPTVSAGGTVLWKGNATRMAINSGNTTNTPFVSSIFSSTGKYSALGNVMSLIYGDNFIGKTSLSGKNFAFSALFSKNENLKSTKNLALPATELSNHCYNAMFSGCTSLTDTPKLPATNLSGTNYCYRLMFSRCNSLTKAPELPATTLGVSCYNQMFSYCEQLITAPRLPATTLADRCYGAMFSGCINMINPPQLPASELTLGCYTSMFKGCTSLTTAPALSSMSLNYECYSDMFSGCTSLSVAPELPATTLAYGCYSEMFMDCTALTTAPVLPATELVTQCYFSMFYNCSSLNYVKAMFTTNENNMLNYLGGDGDDWWLEYVASSGTFVKNSAATWNNQYIVPNGWTVQTASS